MEKLCLQRVRYDAREARLPTPRWSPEEYRRDTSRLDKCIYRLASRDKVSLPHEIIELLWSQEWGEWCDRCRKKWLHNNKNNLLRPYHRLEYRPLLVTHWCDREPVASLEYPHRLETRHITYHLEREGTCECSDISDIHAVPYRLLGSRPRIIVVSSHLILRLIWVRSRCDLREPINPRDRTWRVIKKHPIPHLHHISHIVPGEVVPHAEPARLSISCEVSYRVFRWFGFHEPSLHIFLTSEIKMIYSFY